MSLMRFIRILCYVCLSWSCAASAISLGSPKLLSRAGEPLKVEFPIRFGEDDQAVLSSLKVGISNNASYDRLGISKKLLELNPQAMIYRNQQQQLMVLVETVESVPMADDPFLDVLLTLNWSAGSLTKTYTLLLGDVQKIAVRPGQTLSEIAAQLVPQLNGATLDQTMMALFRANPDAFASGSINRLDAGAELSKPSQALLRSISPAEANQFVAESNAQWLSEHESKGVNQGGSSNAKNGVDTSAKDRLKISSSADGNADIRRYTEDMVAQEKALEQTRVRVAELEKNISDLQYLLDQAKGQSTDSNKHENPFGLGGFAPAILALILMGITGLLLFFLAKNARRSEAHDFSKPAPHVTHMPEDSSTSARVMPDRTKALFAGIDLNLPPSKKPISPSAPAVVNPLADALRVKLNLAHAYITIEDFDAAKKSLQEIVHIGGSIDPAIAVEAQRLLVELAHNNH
jgi:pilus assembly protein FimV